jgi:hypothetical protein
MWDDEAGYDRTDPKHPSWRDNWATAADLARKRAKETAAPKVKRASDPSAGSAASGEGDDPAAGAAA